MIKSVYIHIPFCKKICSYCDFCKVIYNQKWVNDYLKSLEYEIKNNYKNEKIETIYIGGGTPSSLNIDQLIRLFDVIKIFSKDNLLEFTIECNIEDINEDKLRLFKENGVNRISIGIESFSNKYLKYLNRSYTNEIIEKKINLVKEYFDNINVDLIYALKDETLDELQSDIDKIKKLDVSHISCYSLIIEDNTRLKINNTKPINDELDYEMYKLILDNLSDQYIHYEISNYAKKGYESKHNLTYWHNEEYYGFGLGASGYINNERYTNTKNLTKYLNNEYDRQIEIISKEDKIKYELILGFRLLDGIDKKSFYNKYRIDILDIKEIKKLIEEGKIINDKDKIYINKKYLYVLNDILVYLI